MKPQILFLALALMMMGSVMAQNTRNPFAKLSLPSHLYEGNGRPGFKLTALDSTFDAWRFDAGTGYSYPDGNVQAGIGFGIHHIKYTYSTQTFYAVWSASGYIWGGGNVAPKTISDVAKISIQVGILNGAVSFGPYYSIGPQQLKADGTKISKLGVIITTTVHFNP